MDTLLEKPVSDQFTNTYSLVCSITYRNSKVLLTGDIDSTVEDQLSQYFGTALDADLLVSPHHGSASTVSPLFFSLIRPQVAIISAGKNNSYGHPADELTDMLVQLGIPYMNTAVDGSLMWRSNGFYWMACF
jgi:competence protein ComEC